MPLALDQKVGAVVWSPLGWGRLTGKIRRGQPLPETSRLQSKVAVDIGPPVADEYLYTRRRRPRRGRRGDRQDGAADRAELAAAAADASRRVIIGARNEEQLRQNLGAVGWNLTRRAGRQARRRQRRDAGLSLLAPARLRRAQSVPDGVMRRGSRPRGACDAACRGWALGAEDVGRSLATPR